MATLVLMPKQGNTVESCIITHWVKAVGTRLRKGEPLCAVETDKAVLEVESPAAGVLLAQLYKAGDEVPVMTPIAVVGEAGEDYAALLSAPNTAAVNPTPAAAADGHADGGRVAISPRAQALAQARGVNIVGLTGSGPEGRIIERDIRAVLAERPPLTPLARAQALETNAEVPASGSGIGGRVTAADLAQVEALPLAATLPAQVEPPADDNEIAQVIPMRGVRRVTAERMMASLASTAQLTLNASADARALQAYRARLKASDETLGLRGVTINDLILFTVARTLTEFPDLNALLHDGAMTQYRAVHLGFAVDTPRGLLVPVIRRAERLSLKALADTAKRLADAAAQGSLSPDDMSGGTFTVTNLGALGIEHFTPILNPPQVAILGVGAIHLKPVQDGADVAFHPHVPLSLTIDHQAVDGAPGARFLHVLSRRLAQIDLLLAL